MRKVALQSSVSGVLATVLAAHAVHAQTATPPASAQSAAATNGPAIADVVVTAQRFRENAQKVPLIISVVKPSDLKGVSDIRQLQSVDPGIQLGSAGAAVQTFIRGVGSGNQTDLQESSVVYTVDGVVLGTPLMVTPLMYDLDRIEVLKGPQGTLYGRNATAGAVNLITAPAHLGHFDGFIEGEVGNFDLRRATGAINVPVGDTLGIRFAAQHVEHSGYLSDGTNSQNITAGRVRVRWEPSSIVTLQLGADFSTEHDRAPGTSITPNPTNDKWIGALDPRLNSSPLGGYIPFSSFVFGPAGPGLAALTGLSGTNYGYGITALPTSYKCPTPPAFICTGPLPAPYFHNNQWSVNGQLDVNLGFATLTVLPAYRFEKSSYLEYTPGFSDTQQPTTGEESIEVRLANKTDKLTWVVGGYGFKMNQTDPTHIRNESIFQDATISNYRVITQSYAVFGEATYSLTDRLRLIGGLRFTHEQTSESGQVNNLIGTPPSFLGLPNTPPFIQTPAYNPVFLDPFDPTKINPNGEATDYPFNQSVQAHAVTWKAGAQFDLTPSSMIFATVTRGFKGGGVFADIPYGLQPDGTVKKNTPTFKPEYLTAYEFGSRNRFFDNKLQLNADVFYWQLQDQQIPYLGFDTAGQLTLLTANAGKAHMYGVDVNMVWRPTPDDTLTVGVENLEAAYDQFVRTSIGATILTSPVTGQPLTLCKVRGPLTGVVTIDCSGKQMIRAPEWAGGVAYDHRFELPVGDLDLNLSMTFATKRNENLNYTPQSEQGADALFNAALTYSINHVTLTGWIRNIGDARVITGGDQFGPGAFNPYPAVFSRPTVGSPRTFGVSARYSF